MSYELLIQNSKFITHNSLIRAIAVFILILPLREPQLPRQGESLTA